jgi:hypothetical protein
MELNVGQIRQEFELKMKVSEFTFSTESTPVASTVNIIMTVNYTNNGVTYDHSVIPIL